MQASLNLETAPAGLAETLVMEHIEVAYNGDIVVLNDVSLAMRPGCVTGIVGPNGAGKSTVLKTLFGLLRVRAGRMRLGDRDITGLKAFERARHGIAFVPQWRSVFPDMSVDDNLRLGCWTFRDDAARVRRGLDAMYQRFPMLAEARRKHAGDMSGGQQRFLEIARALILEPSLLLLDEPTAMIAPKYSKEIYRLIQDLAAEGVTVGLVDQNVRQCVAISDYLYVLELGRNKAEGDRERFASDDGLRGLVAEWVNYKIDDHA